MCQTCDERQRLAGSGVPQDVIDGTDREPSYIRKRGRPSDYDLDHVFAYHTPTESQVVRYNLIRSAAKALALVVLETTPSCADQQDALRKIREAVMTANAAIALDGRVSKL